MKANEEKTKAATAPRVPYQHRVIAALLGRIAASMPAKHLSKLYALKIVYLADRYHLRKFGRTITEDTYWAMDYGPVASETKRMIEAIAEGREPAPAFLRIGPTARGIVEIGAIGPVDESPLSDTDREATDAALAEASLHQNLVEFTHEFPEWRRQRDAHGGTEKLHRKMPFADFFLPAPPRAEYCRVPPELLRLNLEALAESNTVAR